MRPALHYLNLRNGARMYVTACMYTRRNDWPVVIPSVVHPEVHAAITLLVPRRGIHVGDAALRKAT